jgi:hypothetical protein
MNSRSKAYLIIGVSVLFLLGLLTAKAVFAPKELCDPNIKSKTVILIDHSEATSRQTADAIVERVWQHIENHAKVGEVISIYKVTHDSRKNLAPTFSACKPRSDGSQLTENVKRVKLQFEDFKKNLRQDLSQPITGSNESPIAQAIIDLSLDVRYFQSSDITRFLVFSDFLENTEKFSLYKCTNPDIAIQSFRSSRTGAKERPEFNNVEVQMHLIPRSDVSRAAIMCRPKFWNWFFGDLKCKKDVCLNPLDLPG